MPQPTTTYNCSYPDVIYPGNTQQERSLANNALIQRARDYNIHDEEIKCLQQYIGPHPVAGWTPGGPGGLGRTINTRITRILGTGDCIEQGIICNFGSGGGSGIGKGIDPSGLILAKTGELPEFTNPGTGWVPLYPPDPSGVYCPPFPDEPPFPTPTPTPTFPTYPVPPGYSWPVPDFNPGEEPDAYPIGPLFQYWMWAIGSLQTAWQTQNAQNIKLLPGGMATNGIPLLWQQWLSLPRLWPVTTADMLPGAGAPIPGYGVTGHPAIFEALEHLIHHVQGMSEMFGMQWQVFETGGSPGTFLDVDGAPGINTGSVTVAEDASAPGFLVTLYADDSVVLPAVIDIVPNGGGSTIVGTGDRPDFRIEFGGPLPANTRMGVLYYYRTDSAFGKLGPTMPSAVDRIVWQDPAIIGGGGLTATTSTGDGIKEAGTGADRLMVFDAGAGGYRDPATYSVAGAVVTAIGPLFVGPVYITFEKDDL
jgi:hypothetical protein